MYGSGWTRKKVWGFSDTKLSAEYEKLISTLHKSGINVQDPLEKHGSLLGEPAAKRLRLDDSADTLQDSTESLTADEGTIHSSLVLTQVDDSTEAPDASIHV